MAAVTAQIAGNCLHRNNVPASGSKEVAQWFKTENLFLLAFLSRPGTFILRGAFSLTSITQQRLTVPLCCPFSVKSADGLMWGLKTVVGTYKHPQTIQRQIDYVCLGKEDELVNSRCKTTGIYISAR